MEHTKIVGFSLDNHNDELVGLSNVADCKESSASEGLVQIRRSKETRACHPLHPCWRSTCRRPGRQNGETQISHKVNELYPEVLRYLMGKTV